MGCVGVCVYGGVLLGVCECVWGCVCVGLCVWGRVGED